MKSTPHLITRDHDPRRADQCNLHTHVIANNNKSPIEKKRTNTFFQSFNVVYMRPLSQNGHWHLQLLQWLSLKCSEHQPWQSVATQAAPCLTAWVCGEATSTSGSGLSARARHLVSTQSTRLTRRDLALPPSVNAMSATLVHAIG